MGTLLPIRTGSWVHPPPPCRAERSEVLKLLAAPPLSLLLVFIVPVIITLMPIHLRIRRQSLLS